jgi:hypothetical protein
MGLNRSDNFRDWDIPVETSYSGVDAAGFPFFLWRESADNRLTLSRPRYCCITAGEDQLYFTFYNPAAKSSTNGSLIVAALAAVPVALAILQSGAAERRAQEHLDYVFNTSPPPFLSLVAAFIFASFAGLIGGTLWYVVTTLCRWVIGRFESDGELASVPLAKLDGFQVIGAREAGAMVGGDPAKSGHGLAAILSDGTQMILTGNAWNYESIAEKHAILTKLFCMRRGDFAKPWMDRMKRAAAQAAHDRHGPDDRGVPQQL